MIRMGRLLTMSIIALFSAGVKGTSPSPPPPPGYPPALPSDVPQLPPLPPPPIPSLPPIPPGQPTWHLGARGQSCTAVCSGEGKVCDSLTIATITSAAAITTVAAFAGGCALPRRAPVGRTDLILFWACPVAGPARPRWDGATTPTRGFVRTLAVVEAPVWAPARMDRMQGRRHPATAT